MGVLQYSENETALLFDYEDVLIEKQLSIDPAYFEQQSEAGQEHLALVLIQYACERYLQWSPQKMHQSLSRDILKKIKLEHYLMYIRFPIELDKSKDLWYVSTLIYPSLFSVDETALYLTLYKRVLSGEIGKFPNQYFYELNAAQKKVKACLKYAIQHYYQYNTIEELYAFFGSRKCLAFLRECKIYYPVIDTFDSPVTALHLILSSDQQRPLLYQYYRFNWLYQEKMRLLNEHRGRGRKLEKPEPKRRRKKQTSDGQSDTPPEESSKSAQESPKNGV